MTRQKKELAKKIHDILDFIVVDEQLGCGFAPAGAYDTEYYRISLLSEELARLSHYGSAEEMMMDNRWMEAQLRNSKAEPFPFA